jgi:hypothetical protein
MLVKTESAPFNDGKLRHDTSDQLFITEIKSINSTLDNGECIAAEGPEIGVVSKRKLLKTLED